MTTSHTVLLTFTVNPGCLEEFQSLLRSIETDLPQVSGCTSVRVLRHEASNATFTVLEDWTSQALHTKHVEGLVASGAWSNIEAMLAEPPAATVLASL